MTEGTAIPVTPYLTREPAIRMDRSRCAYCAHVLNETRDGSAYFRTRDHILPRLGIAIRRTDHLGGADVCNTRPCCFSCNQLRAELGHCCGSLVLAVMYSALVGLSKQKAARALGMLPSQRQQTVKRLQRQYDRAHSRAVSAPRPTLADVWPQ